MDANHIGMHVYTPASQASVAVTLSACILDHFFLVFGRYRLIWLPWLRFFSSFSSVVRQMPKYNSQRRGTARTLPNFCVVLCIVYFVYLCTIGFGGLEVAYWPLVPKFAGSNPAEAAGFLRATKILSTPSFGGEVKPSVPCRRFATCKRSLELCGSRILDEIFFGTFLAHEEFHLPLLEVSRVFGHEGT
jgi:hypothetical protein